MVELLLRASEDEVERVSDALIELEALSVSVEDADADTAEEQALFGEPGLPAPKVGWRHSRLVALFHDEAAATHAATLLLAQEWAQSVQVQGAREVAEQDWVRLTQSQYAPVENTPSFWIVPSWHEAPSGAETVIEGIQTNIALHRELMVDAKFMSGGTNIHYLEEWLSHHKR